MRLRADGDLLLLEARLVAETAVDLGLDAMLAGLLIVLFTCPRTVGKAPIGRQTDNRTCTRRNEGQDATQPVSILPPLHLRQ